MASSRLPGKVLLDLAGQTVLSHVIERCNAIPSADIVCCAVSDNRDSDAVALEAERHGVTVYRGSEKDVLDRYYRAAISIDAQIILRVTSDCPILDPQVSEKVIDLLLKEEADISTNNSPPSWPHGLDCEAITFEWLERAWKEAVDQFDREHVSPFIRRHPDVKKVNLEGPGGSLNRHRWTVDYQEDIEFLRALLSQSPSYPNMLLMEDFLEILKKTPGIAELNINRHEVKYCNSAD